MQAASRPGRARPTTSSCEFHLFCLFRVERGWFRRDWCALSGLAAPSKFLGEIAFQSRRSEERSGESEKQQRLLRLIFFFSPPLSKTTPSFYLFFFLSLSLSRALSLLPFQRLTKNTQKLRKSKRTTPQVQGALPLAALRRPRRRGPRPAVCDAAPGRDRARGPRAAARMKPSKKPRAPRLKKNARCEKRN